MQQTRNHRWHTATESRREAFDSPVQPEQDSDTWLLRRPSRSRNVTPESGRPGPSMSRNRGGEAIGPPPADSSVDPPGRKANGRQERVPLASFGESGQCNWSSSNTCRGIGRENEHPPTEGLLAPSRGRPSVRPEAGAPGGPATTLD